MSSHTSKMTTCRSYSTVLVSALLLFTQQSTATPLPHYFQKRDLTAGAKAGLGVGIAVIIILVILICVFFVNHVRRNRHIEAINRERAILAGEKNADGTDKVDKFVPKPQDAAPASSLPRRNKSVKDRLMGPLYRGSMIDMMPVAKTSNRQSTMNRQSTVTVSDGNWETVDGHPILNKPWAKGSEGDNSPRPSFSSKRATRMMMMM